MLLVALVGGIFSLTFSASPLWPIRTNPLVTDLSPSVWTVFTLPEAASLLGRKRRFDRRQEKTALGREIARENSEAE